MRGYALRVQINIRLTINSPLTMTRSLTSVHEIIINMLHETIPIAIIFIYSAIKINAKVPELYSVLNPDTNSDSPSARSKGVRFVSAKAVIIHMMNKGHSASVNIIVLFVDIELNLREDIMIRGVKIVRAILTSYEIVCAILRNAPKSEYLLFEAHPEKRVVYTFMLDKARNIRIPHFIGVGLDKWGYKVQIISAKNKANIGAIMKGIKFAAVGMLSSFVNNFSASAMGCGIPPILTLLGPLRS